MCLAFPGKIIDDKRVDFNGVIREVAFDLVPKAKVGDYVLVHAGFAIEIVDLEEAKKTLDLVKELQL